MNQITAEEILWSSLYKETKLKDFVTKKKILSIRFVVSREGQYVLSGLKI